MFCSRCGTEVLDTAKFCPSCGLDIIATSVGAPPKQEEAPDEINDVREALKDEYEIVKELGRGGMAIVYKGHDLQLERDVAVKVLPFSLSYDADFVTRFQREARTAAQLEHANIIPIYRVGKAGRVIYFTMKFLRGKSLADIIDEGGPLPVDEIRRILIETASALGYAHKNGIVHRDIKPDNILFDDTGRSLVTDFGIAKAATGTRLTGTGMAIGTPHFMSPEQARAQPLDGRSDIYSLGVVAYQCITGRVPFDAEDAFSIGYKHIMEEIPVPELKGAAQSELFEIVKRMMAKQPDDRFQSAEELIVALQGEGAVTPTYQTLSSRPTTPIPQPAIPTAPPTTAPAPARAGATAPTAGAAAPTTPTTPIPSTEPPPRKKKGRAGVLVGFFVVLAVGGGGGGWYYYTNFMTPSATQLVFGVQPSDTAVAAAIPAIKVQVHDAGGNLVPSATDSVTLRIANNAGGGSLSGTVTVAALGGEATFSDISIDKAGTGYTLAAAARGLIGSKSASFDLTDTTAVQVGTPLDTSNTGTLVLANLPRGARVNVDGQRMRGNRLELDAGSHRVVVTASGYEKFEDVVQLAKGQTLRLPVRMKSTCEPGPDFTPTECYDGAPSLLGVAPLVPLTADIQGSPTPVIFWVKVAVDGTAAEVAPLQLSNDPLFTALAAQFAAQASYKPAQKNGVPIQAWFQIQFLPGGRQ